MLRVCNEVDFLYKRGIEDPGRSAAKMNNWDDLQLLKVLSETQSVRGAAATLGVNPSTVTRRLDQLEDSLGVVLFTRSAQGLHATQEMHSVKDHLSAVSDQIGDIHNHLQGFNQRLEGRIRFAVPDAVALEFLLAELGDFSQSYPQIDLEIIPGYQQLDLARGEVDVAIRATDHPPENMVGRPLERVGLAVYANPRFVAEHALIDLPVDAIVEQDRLPWVDWADQGEVMEHYQRIQTKYFPQAHVHIRCDHIHMHRVLLRSGVGAGVLPCFVGDHDQQVERLTNVPVTPGPMLWLLSHPDLRAARRIHVFLEFVTQVFRRHGTNITGTVAEPQ